jgi:hypothetical protein
MLVGTCHHAIVRFMFSDMRRGDRLQNGDRFRALRPSNALSDCTSAELVGWKNCRCLEVIDAVPACACMHKSRIGHDEIPLHDRILIPLLVDRVPHLLLIGTRLQRRAYCTPTARRVQPLTVAAAACAAQVRTQWPQSHLLSCCRPALRWRCRTSASRVSSRTGTPVGSTRAASGFTV